MTYEIGGGDWVEAVAFLAALAYLVIWLGISASQWAQRRRAARLVPYLVDVHSTLGRILMELGRVEEAVRRSIDLIGGPVWVDEVTTTGTTNSTFTVAPARSTASVKFYRMVDNTR